MSSHVTPTEKPGWGFSIGTVSLLVGAVALGALIIVPAIMSFFDERCWQ